MSFHPVMSSTRCSSCRSSRARRRCRSCSPLPEEVRRAADLLERRWTVSILYVSHEGAVRFNEFLQALGSIPPATLAQRLTDLEEAGVFERTVIAGVVHGANSHSEPIATRWTPTPRRDRPELDR
jgi:DNA-binding HxlR family transcriptional regulator